MKKLFVLLLLGLPSCKQAREALIGRYDRYWDFEHYSSLQLHPDSSFVFTGQEGLSFVRTEGLWKLRNKNLLLLSYPDTSNDKPSTVQSEGKTEGNNVLVTVLDNESKPVPGVTILAFQKGDTIWVDFTKEDGRLKLETKAYDSLKFSFIGFTPFTYIGRNNNIEVKMGLDELPSFRFENEKWQIRGNSLIDPRFKGEQKKNKYKKDKRTNR